MKETGILFHRTNSDTKHCAHICNSYYTVILVHLVPNLFLFFSLQLDSIAKLTYLEVDNKKAADPKELLSIVTFPLKQGCQT